MRAADRVLLKRVYNALSRPEYNLVLSNFIWPVTIQAMTIVMLLIYILILRSNGQRQYTWRFFLPGNRLASTAGAVPLYQLALFSLGDQLQAAIQAPPAAYISQTMQSVLSNTSVIWTALLTLAFLHTRYGQVHAIGCILIVISVVVGVSNLLQNGDCSAAGVELGNCITSYEGNDEQFHKLTVGSTFLWYGLFLIGTFPAAVSNVYKQYVLQGGDVDICYASWWSGNFQVIWGWLTIWTLWIPLPGQVTIAPGKTVEALSDTWSCMLGNVPHPGDESCASAHDFPPIFWFVLYLMFNLSFNVLLLWLTKHISATWAQIATVLCLDLTNIFGQFRFIAGGGAQIMTMSDWLATVLASLSLWIYNLEPERKREVGENYFSPWDYGRMRRQMSGMVEEIDEPMLDSSDIEKL